MRITILYSIILQVFHVRYNCGDITTTKKGDANSSTGYFFPTTGQEYEPKNIICSCHKPSYASAHFLSRIWLLLVAFLCSFSICWLLAIVYFTLCFARLRFRSRYIHRKLPSKMILFYPDFTFSGIS